MKTQLKPYPEVAKPEIPAGTILIPLLPSGWAVVDIVDELLVLPYRWRFWDGYAVSSHFGRLVSMHRLILNAPPGVLVDHRDGIGLHNWRDNLRLATHLQNAINRGDVPRGPANHSGVFANQGRWRARIIFQGRYRREHQSLGEYDSRDDAVAAYNDACNVVYGSFAYLRKIL